MKKNLVIPFLLVATPLVVSAQFGGVKDLIKAAGEVVQLLTGIAAAAALLAFFWGLVKFIFAAGGDEKAVTQGKSFMGWGLVALFVMLSVWGIIGFMQRQLNLPNTVNGGGNSVDVEDIII